MTLFQNPFSFRWLDLSSRQCKWFCVVNEHYLAVIWSKVLLIPGLWIRRMSTFIKQFPLTMTSINSLRLSITAFEVICTIFTSPLVDRSPTMKVEWLVLLSFLLQWLTSSKYFSNQMREESCDNFWRLSIGPLLLSSSFHFVAILFDSLPSVALHFYNFLYEFYLIKNNLKLCSWKKYPLNFTRTFFVHWWIL